MTPWRLGLRHLARPPTRLYSTAIQENQKQLGWFFVDSIFPVQVGRWDFRKYIGYMREDYLLGTLRRRLERVSSHGFKVVQVQPHHKDGGAFVQFEYTPSEESSLENLTTEINEKVDVPTWSNTVPTHGSVWIVKGIPWREDMDHFATNLLRVSFDGPDVAERPLFDVLRPYGRLKTINFQPSTPTTPLRATVVPFASLRAASIARNVLQDISITDSKGNVTKLKVSFERPSIETHVIKNWISSHPRIMLPVLVFLLGGISWAIFDPLRAKMIQAKVENWFDFTQYQAYKWVKTTAFEQFTGHKQPDNNHGSGAIWKDRRAATEAIETYLHDLPSSVTFVHGPQGSGKSDLLYPILEQAGRKYLVIDCRTILKATSDAQLFSMLAKQIGYWPVFGFFNSMGHLMDLAAVGLTGQKAGFATSSTEQVQAMLDVCGAALKNVSNTHRKDIEKRAHHEEMSALQEQRDDARREKIRQGIYHDGRIDFVSGNGVMSELGFGDEKLVKERDGTASDSSNSQGWHEGFASVDHEKLRRETDLEVVDSLPIVIVKNFDIRAGEKSEEILDVLAQWAVSLVENQVAHTIVMSDNRESSKRLAKAMPTKPLNTIALYDADSASALAYVREKLNLHQKSFTIKETSYIERLGGRVSDLESLIHKVRGGATVEDAVEDIINRGVAEMRKNAFGDDLEEAKNLSWTREQAWRVLKLLSSFEEMPYHDVLLDTPFKGDEAALRGMESIELIAVGTHNGRPSTIRPGKPVLKYVFERLTKDTIFAATQDIAYNEKVIASAESTIKSCEDELLKLKALGNDSGWFDSATTSRSRFLQRKLFEAQAKIGVLEKKNDELKKVLAKGG